MEMATILLENEPMESSFVGFLRAYPHGLILYTLISLLMISREREGTRQTNR